MPVVQITADEILLPDGRRLTKGDVVHTEEYPGLEAALAGKAASKVEEPPKTRKQQTREK